MIRFSGVSLFRGSKLLLENADATLNPGERLECETMAVAYTGLQSVKSIGWDGHVRG